MAKSTWNNTTILKNIISGLLLSLCVKTPRHPHPFLQTSLPYLWEQLKGLFHATIWEQPLTLGVGPMGAGPPLARRSWHESGPIHHDGFGGDGARGSGLPRCFRVVCPIQHLHKRLRQSSCAQSCSGLCLQLCRSGDCRQYSRINNAVLRLIQMEEGGARRADYSGPPSSTFRFTELEINSYTRAKVDWS